MRQKRCQERNQIPFILKLQFLNKPAQFSRVVAEGPCPRKGRHLLNAVAAKVFQSAIETSERESARRTSRRNNFQGDRFIPALAANAAILISENGRRTKQAHFRVNQVQKAIEYPARFGLGKVPCCRYVWMFRQHWQKAEMKNYCSNSPFSRRSWHCTQS